MNPKISVIIPTRDEGGYIEKTLARYAAVREKLGLEIIVSDGGSHDDTVERARKLADKVVTAVPGQRQTIAIGRNAGAAAAQGDILFHTDADVVIPDVEKFFAEATKVFDDPKVVGAMSPLRIYPEEERLDDRLVHILFNTSIRITNHFGSFLAKGECQFARTSAFRRVGGYNEKVVVGEDGDLFRRMAKLGKIAYMSDLIVYHSPRRFRQTGYMKLLWSYAREGYSLLFFGKNHLKEWRPLR